MPKCRFSIITVCYNAEKQIKETIQSVAEQTYKDYEYIVVDGCSTDTTVEIVRRNTRCIEKVRILVESDTGIYDAMNKGICLASGQYILFLNAGDRLADSKVLSKTSHFMQKNKGDIYYGNVVQELPDGLKANRVYSGICSKKIYFLCGDVICHQAIFADTNILKERNFDTSFKVCADKEWLLYQIGQKRRFLPMHFTVSYVPTEGFSAKHVDIFERETFCCLREYCKESLWIYKIVCAIKRNERMKSVIRKIGSILFFRKEKGKI